MHRMFSNEYLVDHKRLIQALDRKHRAAGTAFSADQSGARDTAQTLKKGAAGSGVLAPDASLNQLVKLFSTVGQVAHDAGMTKFTPFTKSMDATRGAKRMGRDQFASLSDQPVDLDPEAVHAILTLVAEQDGELAKRLASIFNVGEEGEEGEEGEISEDADFPETAGRNVGGPERFGGMPDRGGSMAGDTAGYHSRFPDAGRIGIEPGYGPAPPRYDAFGRKLDGRQTARTSRSGRGSRSASMAMDAGTSAAEEN